MQLLAPRPHNLVGSGLELSDNKNEALKLWKTRACIPCYFLLIFLSEMVKAQASRRKREAERGEEARPPPPAPFLSEERPLSVLGVFALK